MRVICPCQSHNLNLIPEGGTFCKALTRMHGKHKNLNLVHMCACLYDINTTGNNWQIDATGATATSSRSAVTRNCACVKVPLAVGWFAVPPCRGLGHVCCIDACSVVTYRNAYALFFKHSQTALVTCIIREQLRWCQTVATMALG